MRDAEQKTRKQSEVIAELTRPVRQIFGPEGEEEDDDGQPYTHVPGEVAVRDSDGDIIGYELPQMMDDSFEDFDFGELDWDEIIDDIGDEDEASYGDEVK